MGLRPGHCYSDIGKDRPYTRTAVKVHKKNYIGATPGIRTRQWNMGNGEREYTHILDLVSDGAVQLRDNALEASRLIVNRYLVKHVGKDLFFMKIRCFPHQILRENKLATGAGSDRISKGMSHSFGKAIGRAVRVRRGQKIMSVLVMESHVETARKALLRCISKLPTKMHVDVGTDVASIGTVPRRTRLRMAEEAAKAAATEGKEAEAAEGKEGEKKGEKKTSDKAKEKDKIAAAKAAEERAEKAKEEAGA